MSNDSSNKPEIPVQKTHSFWRAPKKEWAIVGGAVFGVLALFAPLYVLSPFFSEFLGYLPISIDFKMSIAQAIVAGASLLFLAAILAVYRKRFRDIGFDRPTLLHAGKAVLGFLAYIVLTVLLATIYQYVFNQPDQPQEIGYSKALGGLELVLAGLALIVLVPIKEELIFRGFMFAGFRRRLPFWLAAVGVSAIFGLVHGQWNVGIDVFAMSMVSCYLVETTKSLWPSIILHMIKNSVAFYLLYLYTGG